MSQTVSFARWSVTSDPESTRKAYAATGVGAPEACGCAPCRNFAAQREVTYPLPALDLFASLGIEPNREAEIYHLARLASGRHLYGGWFHFVGAILDGRDAARQISEKTWQPDLEPVSDGFDLGFTSRTALVPKPFAGLPVVQVEFSAQVPWILQEDEPQ
jgi:hypothetical protein